MRRLLRGAYVESAIWTEADARERHILRLRAIDGTRAAPPVFSHVSAAALHGLPVLGAWPAIGHVSSDTPGRSRNGVAYHQALPGRIPDFIGGLACTSLVDTLVDLALSTGFRSATISIDHALHGVALTANAGQFGVSLASPEATQAATEFKAQLMDTLHRSAPARNFRRAEKALLFASHLSESPGESLSRCGIHLLGFPAPELQHEFYDYLGFIGRGDFWWPGIRLLGEFDGEDKYKNPAYLGNRTPHQALIDEKRREDRIRQTKVDVSRWDWKTALELPGLYAKLFAAGLRPTGQR
ncbi:MAG TPA: hypothetical protein VFT01_03125 [Homoserinimonas sp.]|nr:hypothetical protein [Homoserinimonas sp.]